MPRKWAEVFPQPLLWQARIRNVLSSCRNRSRQIPSEFMLVAQCGSFINEDLYNAAGYLDALNVEAMISNINSWEKLSPDFKTKVSAQTVFEK